MLGTPMIVLRILYDTLINMKNDVRTGLGDSTQFIPVMKKKLLQEGGQGNGACLPIWLGISVILLQRMDAFNVNATFLSAISRVVLTVFAVIHVDNRHFINKCA